MKKMPKASNLKIVYRKTAELIPYARNSRTHSDAQVAQIAGSITEFGFTNPVLIDEADGIIAGHGRIMAAGLLKLDEVPTITLAGLSEAQKRAYVIADNRLPLNAGWDFEMLAVELGDLRDSGFDVSLLGFEAQELNDLIGTPNDAPDAGSVEEGELPEPPEDPASKAGDVWLLGEHRLMCGDSTSKEAVALLMAGGKADMLITDPPYNVAYEGKTEDALTIENDSMSGEEFRKFLVAAYGAGDSVMRPGAAFYIWFADVETYNFVGALVDVGWPLRQMLIWNKNSLVLGRKDYHFKHEPCLYGWKPGAAHYWGSDRSQTTVLDFNKPSRNGEHPTMKPVELFAYQIINSSEKGGFVLDLFGGSGTTLIACEQHKRRARLMELDPRYVDVIVRRWQEFTGQDATLEGDGRTFDEIADERIAAG